MIADAVGLELIAILLGRNVFHYYTLLTMVQAALLFLIGGGRDMSGSLAFTRILKRTNQTEKSWTLDDGRRAQEKATPLILAGIMLLCFTFILAYPLG